MLCIENEIPVCENCMLGKLAEEAKKSGDRRPSVS